MLHVLEYRDLDEAIALQNEVPQALSAEGSDDGLANIDMGPPGAEIGGACGGEQETGGGRESGPEAWKASLRRQTSAVNDGRTLPRA